MGGVRGQDTLPACSGPDMWRPADKERLCWTVTGDSGMSSLHSSVVTEGFLEEEEEEEEVKRQRGRRRS